MKRIYTVIGWIATLTMPAAAAANFGLAAYETFLPRAGVWFAVLVGALTATGFEAAGVLLGHTAIAYHSRGNRRWLLSAAGMGAYVAVGSIELYRIPFSRFVPFLAALVYFAVALLQDVETAISEEHEERQNDKAFKRQMQMTRMKLKHEQEMARIHAGDAAHMQTHPMHDANGSAAYYECECGQVFDSPQKYAAHKRWQHQENSNG